MAKKDWASALLVGTFLAVVITVLMLALSWVASLVGLTVLPEISIGIAVSMFALTWLSVELAVIIFILADQDLFAKISG